jgi:hypothetical protein
MGVEIALAAMAGMVGGQLLGGRQQSQPQTQAATPPPQTQDAKAPDQATVRANNMGTGQAGGSPGVAQTMLTGPGGIDPKLLKLGKNTLLGG